MTAIVRKMGDGFTAVVQRVMPDAYIFCLVLTVVAMLSAITFTKHGPSDVVLMWGDGFWKILTFSAQSSLALIGGFVLSNAPLFKKGLGKLAGLPRTHSQAIVLSSLASLGLWYFHWGVGAVATGIVAVEVARQAQKKGIKLHYPLIVAAAYVGSFIWHIGFSGAAQLLVATENHFLAKQIGVIPVGKTIFAPGNIVLSIILFILAPVIMLLMMPKDESKIVPPPAFDEDACPADLAEERPGENAISAFLHDSPVVTLLVSSVMLTFLVFWMFIWKKGFNLNIFVVLMLASGLLLHRNFRSYVHCLQGAIKTAVPIMVQFQFYGGIMGILVSSGLAIAIANFFVSISNGATFPVFSFISAGLVNMFVPSGGGQWIVQGPVIIDAAKSLNANIPQVITAFGCGDGWTNLLQPFWALPLLAMAGLKVRDMMGYCGVLWFFSFFIISGCLLLFPYI